MDNLFRTELIQSWSKSGPVEGTGEWHIIENEQCISIKPAPYYKNLPEEASGLLVDLFLENTSYIFDIWENADYSTNDSGGWSTGGISIVYTDGTSDTTLYVTGGDGIGFQHKKVITPSDKTIKKIGIRYGYNKPVYYRWDSYIAPYTIQNLNKLGQIKTNHIIENKNPASFLKGGSIYCNNFYEY